VRVWPVVLRKLSSSFSKLDVQSMRPPERKEKDGSTNVGKEEKRRKGQ
jgi:hypothetical protein